MSKQPTHDVLLPEDYEAADGEQKIYYTNIGSAWQNPSGMISIQFREGLAVSGRVMVIPKKEKKAEASDD